MQWTLESWLQPEKEVKKFTRENQVIRKKNVRKKVPIFWKNRTVQFSPVPEHLSLIAILGRAMHSQELKQQERITA